MTERDNDDDWFARSLREAEADAGPQQEQGSERDDDDAGDDAVDPEDRDTITGTDDGELLGVARSGQ